MALPSAWAQQEVIRNGGFETGSLAPWYGSLWSVSGSGAHSGHYCAYNGNTGEPTALQQDFPPTPVENLTSVTFWLRQYSDYGIAWVTFYYSDGTSNAHQYNGIAGAWTQQNATSYLLPDKSLTGIEFQYGFSDDYQGWIDDVSILTDVTPPSVSITLTPVNPPIIIPANGGSFDFNLALANSGTTPATVDVWTAAYTPTGEWVSPIIYVRDVRMAAGASLSRLRTQFVPASAPPGEYLYCGFVGDYPTVHLDSSYFALTKLTVGNGPPVSDWSCTGEPFSGETVLAVSLPSTLTLSASPNPFNPTTVASLELPVASRVSLRVYDISGRLVATLADGWREAGRHDITFDGSDLPSGIYLARLSAGDWSQTQKLVLLK